jgi:hypothetical protein
MAQYEFGSGVMFGTRTDIPNPTPIKFGALQDVSLDWAFTNKELHGQYSYPLDVGRGAAKVAGKAKAAAFSSIGFNSVFFADQLNSGQLLVANDELHAIPGSVAYTVTVTNGATFTTDLGVTYAATGIPFVNVASAPAVGQYEVASGGVYTFALADASANIKINYAYSALTGNTITINNPLMGSAPTFSMVLYQSRANNVSVIVLNRCIATKLAIATKLEDFSMFDFEFSAFTDASNQLGTWGTSAL